MKIKCWKKGECILRNHYNVVFVGSGPNALGALFYLKKHIGNKIKDGTITVTTIDKDPYPAGGLMNDGKEMLTPFIGFDDYSSGRVSLDEAWEHIRFWEDVIVRHGKDAQGREPPISGVDEIEIRKWQNRLSPHGLELITETRQRHIGTDRSRGLIDNMRRELQESGIEFRLKETVQEITRREGGGFTINTLTEHDQYTFTCDYLVLGPGRVATPWFKDQLRKLEIVYRQLPIEVGFRVEMRYEDYPVAHNIRAPMIKIRAPNGDPVKTFCTNPNGRIRLDMPSQAIYYNGRELRMVNGDGVRSERGQTPNINFAVLTKVDLTNPPGDNQQFAIRLAGEVFHSGDWKPVAQRLGKFLENRRSKPSDFYGNQRVQPTLSRGSFTPGDLTFNYPGRVCNNILYLLRKLAEEMPMVMHQDVILTGPEIKFQNITVDPVDRYLQSPVPGLYLGGNGPGYSSGIVGAASNGILIAKGLIERLG